MGDHRAIWSRNSPPGGRARASQRTIFAVGDEKQSIFSFQGAAPEASHACARTFERALSSRRTRVLADRASSIRSARRRTCSARSTRCSRAREHLRERHRRRGRHPAHQALPDAAPGLVEIWPLDRARRERREIEGWDAPFDTARRRARACKLARRIAAHVRADRACDASARRQRTMRRATCWCWCASAAPLFEAIIRALKNAGIRGRRRRPAGADRAHRGDGSDGARRRAAAAGRRSCAGDACSRARCSASTRSDCSSSPGTATARCARRLRGKAASEPHLPTPRHGSTARRRGAARRRRSLSTRACSAPERRPATFLARLGPEANDALDEFLNLALDYERRETPSLQGFVAWLRARASRGQARHGDRARRSAGDDRARRQGPGGADRHPRRHHDAAGRATLHQPRLLPLPATRAAGPPTVGLGAAARTTTSAAIAARARARAQRGRATNTAGCSMSR